MRKTTIKQCTSTYVITAAHACKRPQLPSWVEVEVECRNVVEVDVSRVKVSAPHVGDEVVDVVVCLQSPNIQIYEHIRVEGGGTAAAVQCLLKAHKGFLKNLDGNKKERKKKGRRHSKSLS